MFFKTQSFYRRAKAARGWLPKKTIQIHFYGHAANHIALPNVLTATDCLIHKTIKLMKKVLFFFGALALLGLNWHCERINNQPDNAQLYLGDTLELEYGQSITLLPDNIEIRFDSVVSESRCPVSVDCIWAGTAEVKLRLKQGQVEETIVLSTYTEPHSAVVFGKTVTLIDVSPYPQDPLVVIPQEDYRVQVVVEDQ